MSVCPLGLPIELCDDIEVTHLLEIVRRDIVATPHYHPDLELLLGFGGDVKLFVELDHLKRDQIQPEPDIPLAQSGGVALQLPGLDGVAGCDLILVLPESILHVDLDVPDQVIHVDVILVPDFDGENALQRKVH